MTRWMIVLKSTPTRSATTESNSTGRPPDSLTKTFKATSAKNERYEREGLLEIVGEPHRESMSGQRHVDRVKVKLTPEGVRR
jgi:hypothetical protein